MRHAKRPEGEPFAAGADQKPAGLLEQLQEHARRGNFGGLLELFAYPGGEPVDYAELAWLLRHAVNQAADQEPSKFCDDVHRHLVASSVHCQLRLQACLEHTLAQAAREPMLRERLPATVEAVLPVLERVARLTAELATAWAAAARKWE